MTTVPAHPEPPTTAPATPPPGRRRGHRGEGCQRERRPGVWEVRVPIEPDPGTGRSRRVSVTVHGTAEDAAAERARLLAWYRDHRETADGPAPLPPPDRVTLSQLLEAWLAADHPWRPSTLTGYRSVSRGLLADPLARCRAQALTPQQVRQAIARWRQAGAGIAVVDGRFRVLRSCLSWAYNERHLDTHPLRLMRGPGRTAPRRPLTDDQVRALLLTAELRLLEAQANLASGDGVRLVQVRRGLPAALGRVHRAEQNLLMVRLAADTGARRGEIAALRLDDLTGRTLRIERSLSAGELTTPKSGHGRILTVGADTAALWHSLEATWTGRLEQAAPELSVRVLGPWVFTADLAHHRRLGSEVLGHRFERVREAAGVPDATLHRLRHTVATFLVSRGLILQAQARLGHGDAATTLREYAHALPGTDAAVADAINANLDLSIALRRAPTWSGCWSPPGLPARDRLL